MSDLKEKATDATEKYEARWAKGDAQRDELHVAQMTELASSQATRAAQMAELASSQASRAAQAERDERAIARHAEELANVWAHRKIMEEVASRHAAAWERLATALERLASAVQPL